MITSDFTRLLLTASLIATAACGDDDSSSDDAADTGQATGDAGTADGADDGVDDGADDGADDGVDDGTADGVDDDGSDDSVDDGTDDGGEMAEIRVLHLGVNAPGVDVFANGEGPVVDNLEFRNSTAYLMVPTGTSTFEVSVTGTSVEEAVLAPEVDLAADTKYTAVAIGDLNETDGAPGLQAIAIVDDDADIDAANVRITVVHAAPAVGEVDIWEISDLKNPVALLEDVPFGASAGLPDIPAGPLEIGVDVDNDAVPDVTFSVDATAAAGAQVNVYANNDAEGAVALVLQLPDGTVLPIAAN